MLKKTNKLKYSKHSIQFLNKHYEKVRKVLFVKRYNRENAPKIQRDLFNTQKKKLVNLSLNYCSNRLIDLNYGKYLRSLELVFCQSLFKSDNQKDISGEKMDVLNPFFEQINFKRVYKIINDLKKYVYCYLLEEKRPDLTYSLNCYNNIKIQNELNLSPDQRLNLLSTIVERYHQFHKNLKEDLQYLLDSNIIYQQLDDQISIEKVQLPSLTNLNLGLKKRDKRIYQIDIGEEVFSIITRLPYVMIQKDYLDTKSNNDLISQYHNRAFNDVVKCLVVSIDHSSDGFGVFSTIYSKDWPSYYRKLMNFNMDLNQASCQLNPDELYLVTKDGKLLNGYFTLYKQIYFEFSTHSTNFFFDTYFVFTLYEIKTKKNKRDSNLELKGISDKGSLFTYPRMIKKTIK